MNKNPVNKRIHKKQKPQLKPVYAAILLAFSATPAIANPVNPTVVSGQASFAASGSTLTITNTPGTIINWQGFSIGATEITRFAQQSASSAVLNRVVSNNPSSILGTLQSNGRVFLINPNGIVFGAGATVDVAGLVASSLNLSNDDFLAGRYNFTAVPGAQKVSNAGNVSAQDGGQIYLIAPDVENTGVITAQNGEILLAAGHSVDLVNSNSPNLIVNITAPAGDATNIGQLIAESGSLGLFGTVVRNSGTVSADSATMEGGRIVFRASQRVEAGGTISAQGAGGGTIEVLANMQDGTVNVTGNINASAPVSGNGGFIDTSAAHVQVADSVRVTTLAANGANGTWLIDPFDFNIAATGGNMTGTALSTSLAAGNVVIASTSGTTGVNGDVNVNDTVAWSANVLTLNAQNNININTAMNGSGTAGLALEYGQGAIAAGNTSTFNVNAPVNLASTGSFTTKLGSDGPLTNYIIITTLGNAGVLSAPDLQGMAMNLSANFVLGGDIDATATAGWNGGLGFSPLGNGITRLSGNFSGLGHSISNLTINTGQTYAGLFGRIGATGRVADVGLLGGTVSGSLSAGGLVGWNEGVINNSYASGVVVNGFYTVGGLVGLNSGTISNSYVSSGTLSGGVALDLGGLVGLNKGSISTSYVSDTTVFGAGNVGGLVGRNEGGAGGAGIVGSTSVTGAAGTDTTISNSYVNGGSVTGTTNVGGLVGLNQGGAGGAGATATTTAFPIGSGGAGGKATISNSYASGGLVSGTTSVGGLIGSNLSGSAGAPGSFGAQGGAGGVASTVSSLWDFDTTGRAVAIGTGNQDAVTQLNSSTATINAFNQTTYAGWDFTGTWWMSNLNTRPFLRSEWSANITNAHQLQLMSMDLGAVYKLGANLDMSGTATSAGMWGVKGFVPVGTNVVTNFTGKLDGAGNTISNLFINQTGLVNTGLFGWMGAGSAVNNLGLANSNITGWYRVGSLAGYSEGSINNVMVTGTSVAESGFSTLGGLVGQAGFGGSITNSYVDGGTVIGHGRWIGGLVGLGAVDITGSHVNNTVVNGGITADSIGGLVGWNSSGVISNSYVSGGSVSGQWDVGGLVGWNTGFITGGSYTNGVGVSGQWAVGGLVGYNQNVVLDSHVLGANVSGNTSVGGLAGYSTGSITNSYVSSGAVTATWYYGGLVGFSPVTSPISNSHYNINGVTINGTNLVTRFGLYNNVLNTSSVGQFDDWLNGGNPAPLNIANYAMLPGSGGNYTVSTLLGMRALLGFADNPAYTFTLTANIDLATRPGYYIPLLAADFNGGNFTISNLSLNQQNDFLGLFGMIGKDGSVSNLKLLNVSVTGINNIGGLAGWNEGSIVNSSSTSGNVSGSWDIGGLVGHNEGLSMFNSSTSGYITGGSISGSFVSGGSVTGVTHVGGLVGSILGGATTTWNPTPGAYFGTISNSYVTGGTVSGSTSVGVGVGGLVGYALGGGIFNSYVDSGNVSGGSDIGGLVGFDSGEGGPMLIDSSYVNLTSVTGWSYVGGLVGNHGGSWLTTNVSINNSYVSNGSVSGGWNVGGLVGYNGTGTRSVSGPSSFFFGASISNSYVTGGTVTGSSSNVGGLAGFNKGAITNSYVSGGSVNGGWNNVGGLVGYNTTVSGSGGSSWGWWRGGSIANSFVDTGTVVSGLSNVGGLVGNNFGDISSSHVSNGVVSATGAGFVSLGGLVGINQGSISNSYVDGGSVTAVSGSTIGGLVGYNSYGSVINSYVSGGTVTGRSNVGGLVGSNFYGNVFDTYVIGSSVIATSLSNGVAGGLVGYNLGAISNSYASNGSLSVSGTFAGGVVGQNGLSGAATGTFWDTSVGLASGIGWDDNFAGPSNNGATGLATADTMNSITLASAGFGMTNWWMSDGNTRPFLQMEWSANITNSHQLQLMSMNLGAAYTLGVLNLDMSETATGTGMWSSAGFVPVGDSVTPFTGTFDGLNNTISNLTINSVVTIPQGLFGYTSGAASVISNVGLINANVAGSNSVGALLGYNGVGNLVINSYVSGGTISGGGGSVGGLVGANEGSIGTSYVDGVTVNGGNWSVGGLTGRNLGSITASHVTNSTVSGTMQEIGGLVGVNSITGSIADSYVIGSSVSGAFGVGGLVGMNDGLMSNSHYNINFVLINGGTVVTVGGLFNDVPNLNLVGQFDDWFADGVLNPADYATLTAVGVNSYSINSVQGMKDLLGFAEDPVYSFSLAGHIDLAAAPGLYIPVLAGNFDGANFTVSNLNVSGVDFKVGLFGELKSSGTVSNLGVLNANITAAYGAAGLVGYNNGGTITNCFVDGATLNAFGFVGGMVGWNDGTINNAYVSNSSMTATQTSGTSANVGGLVGNNTGTISNSYVSGGSVTGALYAGGVVGYNDSTLGASVAASFWDAALTGGVLTNGVGFDTILVGGTDVGATGLSAVGMMTMTNFSGAGWNIANTGGAGATWRIYEGYTAPLLTSFLTPLTATANSATKTYDSIAYSGGNGTTLSIPAAIVSGTPVYGGTSQGAVNAGIYTLSVSGYFSGQTGYDIIYVDGSLTINAATVALSITASDTTKTYGTTLTFAGNEFTSAGLLGGDTISGVTLTSAGAVDTAGAGTYAITPGSAVFSVGSASNYIITYVDGQLTVTAAPLTVTADAMSKIYGDTDPALTYVATGLLFTDTLTGGLNRAVGENVGSYVIGSTLANPNYTITYVGNNLSITARPVTISADAVTKVYGDADPALTFTVGGSGLASWDTNATVFTGALSRTAGEDVATSPYAINQGTLAANANYTITYVGSDLTITARPVTISADAVTKVYGDADNLTFTVGGSGLASWDTNATAFTGALSRTAGEDVATSPYAINQGSLAANTNYTITYVGSDLTITARPVTISADAVTKVYGDADNLTFAVGGSGLASWDTNATAFTGALSRTAGEDVATSPYAINQGSLAANANYTVTYVGNDLTITARPATITADVLSKVYGDADPALTYVATGLLFTDTLTGGLSRTAGENVGSYAIGSTLANPNYTITYVGNNLTITARPVTISADAVTKVYGDADNLTFTVGGSGLASWDTNATAFAGALSRTAGEDVATSPYAINQGTLAATNYTITGFTGNNLTITPAPLMVYAYPTSKVLNTPDPLLTYLVSGLKFNDTAATVMNGGSLVRDPGEAAGNYLINQGSLALASTNYTMTYVPANFTILVPTVIDEITNMILLLGTPDSGSAQSTSSSDEDDKKPVEAIVTADASADTGTPAQALPVCQ